MYASSFGTRYRNGLGPPFFSLTKPQTTSLELPSAFAPEARFISTNSTEAGLPIFAVMVAFAFLIAGSDWSSNREVCGVSGLTAMEDVIIALSSWDDNEASAFGRMSDLAVLVSVLAWCRTAFFLAAITSPCNAFESIFSDAASEHPNAVASVHPDNHAVCCGANEHPIKVAVRAVVRSGLMKNAPLKKRLRNFSGKAVNCSLNKWLTLSKASHG
jgi:hypothetical protein